MTSDAEYTIDALRKAFPSKRAGPFSPLVNSIQGDEPRQVDADFADKDDWTAIAADWLDGVADTSAPIFLSDAAIRFYIPAYLVADLTGQLHQIDPTFILIQGFDEMSRDQRIWPRKETTWTNLARARWDALSREQAVAIVHYLEWRVGRAARGGPALTRGISEALSAYWYLRASTDAGG